MGGHAPTPAQASSPRGPSEVVDHAALAWHDAGWRGLPLPGSVLYELHVGTFSEAGTFDGALPHLVELGVDAEEVPDPQDPATFERSTSNWDEPQRLERVRVDHGDDWLVVERGPLIVAANLGPDDRSLRVLPGQRTLAASHPEVALVDATLRLPPESVAILGPAQPLPSHLKGPSL